VLHAVQLGVRLEGLADFEYPVYAGGVPGDAELVEGLPGVGAGAFGVVLGGFDGGQVAEDDGALLVIGAGRAAQRSVLEPQAYAEAFENALLQLEGDNREGDVVRGAEFWMAGADGAGGLTPAMPGAGS
jgi:hypothetical protein